MDKQTAHKILSLAMSQNAAAEVFIRSSASTTVEVKDQKVEAFDRARDAGVGLRVIMDGRMGFAFTSDLSDSALKTLAQSAVTNARNTEPDPFQSIPEKPVGAYQAVNIHDPVLVRLSEKEKIDRTARPHDRRGLRRAPRKAPRRPAGARAESETVIMN